MCSSDQEIDGVEERLQSRFGGGLTVAVEPQELEKFFVILFFFSSRRRHTMYISVT